MKSKVLSIRHGRKEQGEKLSSLHLRREKAPWVVGRPRRRNIIVYTSTKAS